jgi:hypothetical protein
MGMDANQKRSGLLPKLELKSGALLWEEHDEVPPAM